MEKQQNKRSFSKSRRDSASVFAIIFALLFIAMGVRGFLGAGSVSDMMAGNINVRQSEPVELSFSDVLRRGKDIKTMNIHGADATGIMKDGTKYTATITYDPELLSKLAENGTAISIDTSKSAMEYLGTWFPILISLLFLWWLFRGMRGGAGGITRGLAQQNPTKITTGKPKTTFADVAGIDSEKQELMEVVDFLKNKEKFTAVGARVPRGVLLSGEPGTGKTLLARAIAGEANVPFFAASGSDFSGIIVGLGVAKIKEIFEMAKRN